MNAFAPLPTLLAGASKTPALNELSFKPMPAWRGRSTLPAVLDAAFGPAAELIRFGGGFSGGAHRPGQLFQGTFPGGLKIPGA